MNYAFALQRRPMIAIFLTSLALVTSCRPPSSVSESKHSFRIGMVTFAGYAPLYLAKEKGFFGNLNVQLVRIEDIPSIRAAMERRDLDGYLATPDIAMDTNNLPPGQAVWAIDESAGGDGVVVASSIHGLNELKGKRVAAEPGLPPYFVMLYLLNKAGLSKNDVSLQDMSTQNAAAAFASRSVDAAAIYQPYLSEAMKQRPGSRVAISSKQTPDMIVDLILARKDVIDSRPSDILELISGWRTSMRYIREHPQEAFPMMAKAFGLPVGEFRNIATGIIWLDLSDNQHLFGTKDRPGELYKTVSIVRDVLKRNRPDVYMTQPEKLLNQTFVSSIK